MGTKVGNFIRFVYAKILRPAIFKAIDDPDQLWDDVLLDTLDKIFQYAENGE